jgi:tRNA 2-selenouridine synthase
LSQLLSPAEFLDAPGIVLDVRSPAEYAQGHLPNAVSFPLFTNEERSQVGICYKQEGRDRAVELGFAIVGPKCADLIAEAKKLAADRQVRLHCWRGGMRSESVAWILRMAGLNVAVLEGGYKAFRRWAHHTFETAKPLIMLGGMTGTGKTVMLTALAEQGAQVLDLERLANHRGSSYGSLGLPTQPTNEQFENQLAMEWAGFELDRPLWVEAESRRIGVCRLPDPIFQQMDRAVIIEAIRSRAERLALLVELYGVADRAELITATERIRKKLGGLRTQQAVEYLQQGKLTEACNLILDYYDKTYTHDLRRRNVPIHSVDVTGLNPAEAAALLLEKAAEIHKEFLPGQTQLLTTVR